MNNRFGLNLIVLLLIAIKSEALFFGYPKNALIEFLRSLKEKKEAIKKSHQDVHHYHLHYYPVPFSVVLDEGFKVPDKLEDTHHPHREELRSFGWAGQEYKHVPESPVHFQQHDILPDPWLQNHQSSDSAGLTIQDQLDIDAIRNEVEHRSRQQDKRKTLDHHHQTLASLHLPLHQEIVLHPPTPRKEEKKTHPFTAFFQKLQHVKNSLFGSHDHEKRSRHCEDEIDEYNGAATVTTKLIYFQPRYFRRY